MFTYVVEHMEEDENTPKFIPPWVELEYAHMRTLAGPDSTLVFTHLSPSSAASLSSILSSTDSALAPVQCHTASVLDLLASTGVPLDHVCLLDPKAPDALSPADGDGRFKSFLFGGILGDDPPRDRTSELRALGFPTRHLGTTQMTTDTALGVTKRVVQDKVPLHDIPYIDFPTITFSPKESVEMPFRYIASASAPLLPPGMCELLHADLDKAFEF